MAPCVLSWLAIWYFRLMWCIKLYYAGVKILIREFLSCHNGFEDLPQKPGHVAIVTGGACGIGFEVTKALTKYGVHVVIASRRRTEADAAINKIKTGNIHAEVEFLELDLASLTSVRKFSEAFLKKDIPLNILINNAGVMMVDYHETDDGFESQLGVNYIGHLYLTQLLTSKLKESGTENICSRVINVSSAAHEPGIIDITWFSARPKHDMYSPHLAYAQSKLAIILATYELQNQLRADNSHVTVNALHPGVVNSGIYANLQWPINILFAYMGKYLFKTPRQGSDTTLYLALSTDMEGFGGGYYDNCSRVDSNELSYSRELQQMVWTRTCELLTSSK